MESKKNAFTDYDLDMAVIIKLEELSEAGKLSLLELDDRAIDALKEFAADDAIAIVKELEDSSLEHVSNKSAYLCGIMKTYRQKTMIGSHPYGSKGPDEDKIRSILDRTGYSLDVTTGQRKYGGPPPGWEKPTPGSGCELFVGRIPKSIFEDELIPIFEKCGEIWDLRLMMDPLTCQNRGYAFVTFCDKESAEAAVRQLDNYEIRIGKHVKVSVSVPNLRLFVGNIPKSKSKEELLEEFRKLTAGILDAIVYTYPDDKRKNRGFCFLEYESHKTASSAKRKLGMGKMKLWGCDIIVDWADPQEEPDKETMSKVKVLYVRNLTLGMTEDELRELYEPYGKIDRVKKIKDYAFVHFEDREAALKAMEETNGNDIGNGALLEVSLAKPPCDKKKKEEILRNRERRMMTTISSRHSLNGSCGKAVRLPDVHNRGYGDYDYYGGYDAFRAGGNGSGGYGNDSYREEYYGGGGYDDYGFGYNFPFNNSARDFVLPPHPNSDRMAPNSRSQYTGNQRANGGGRTRGSNSRGTGNGFRAARRGLGQLLYTL